MDTQIEQLNLSSITKFALAYAGITTVSELKEYNYISLANVLPRNCSLNPIMKELNTYGYIFPPENEIPISSIPMSKRLYNILDRNNILYISQLTHYAREEIMQFRNLGSTTLIELDALCQKYHVKINSLSIFLLNYIFISLGTISTTSMTLTTKPYMTSIVYVIRTTSLP